MNVYAVLKTGVHWRGLTSIFSTEEAAINEAVRILANDAFGQAVISKWEVDEPIHDSSSWIGDNALYWVNGHSEHTLEKGWHIRNFTLHGPSGENIEKDGKTYQDFIRVLKEYHE